MKNKFHSLIKSLKDILYNELIPSTTAKDEFVEYSETACFLGNPEFIKIYNHIIGVHYNGIIKDSHNYSNGKSGVLVLDDKSELEFRTMEVVQPNGKNAKYLLFSHDGIKIGLVNLWERWLQNETLFVCEDCPLQNSSINKLITVATTTDSRTKQLNFYTDKHAWFGKAWQHAYQGKIESLLAYKDFTNTSNCIIKNFTSCNLPDKNPLVLSQQVPTKTKIIKISDLNHPEEFYSNPQPLIKELEK